MRTESRWKHEFSASAVSEDLAKCLSAEWPNPLDEACRESGINFESTLLISLGQAVSVICFTGTASGTGVAFARKHRCQYDFGSPSECSATKFRTISRDTGATWIRRASHHMSVNPYSSAKPFPPCT